MNNNNEFEFIFEQDGNLFLQVDFPKSDLLTLNIQSYDTLELATSISESSLISPPGKATSIPFKKGYSIKIKLSYKSSSKEKGTIWMNPSTSEIKIDLNKKYEWKYDYKAYRVHNTNFPLIYSIDNAEKAVILVFKFNENLHIYGDYIALNPLTINHENFNMPNITNFKIEKGESYKIKASLPYWYLNNLKYIHFLPSFSLNFVEKAPENEAVFEFGQGMPFDIYKNREFYFTFNEVGTLFIQIEFPKSNLLMFNVKSCDNYISESSLVAAPQKSILIPYSKGYPVKINLSYKYSSNEKGIIWMFPSTKPITVDLKQKYELKYDFVVTLPNTIVNPFSYSIDKAEKDAILEIKFNDKLKINGEYIAPNPLRIFQENYYRIGVTNYEIKKGESYKILVSIPYWNLHKSNPSYIHFIPSYSFHFIRKEQEKEPEKEQEKTVPEKEQEKTEPEKEPQKEVKKEEKTEPEKEPEKEAKKEKEKEPEKEETKKEKEKEQEKNVEENEEEEEEPIKKEEKKEEPIKKEGNKENKEEPVKKEEKQEKKNFLGLSNLTNWQIICIIIISIAIIGIIIFLICRKKRQAYKGKDNKKFIELEVSKQKILNIKYLQIEY